MRTLTAGGLFGMGPGGGTRKFGLPEPHTDYIFSVIGEEFGLIACLAIALLYLDHRRAGADQAARRGIQLRDARRRRARHPVRAAGADQHGGQRPDRSVEGHDPAVHQLRRIVDAGAVDRHGLAARIHAAKSLSDPLALCREVERGAAPHGDEFRSGRRGHRRTYGPGACARGGIEEAWPWGAADHRRSRRALSRPVREHADAHPAGRAASAAARSAGSRRARRCSRGGARRACSTAGPPRRGDRLRRISGRSGAARGERRWASRPSCTSRMPCSAAPTAALRATRRRSPPPTPRSNG